MTQSIPPAGITIRRAIPDDAAELSTLAKRSKANWGYPRDWLARWDSELTFTRAYLDSHRAWVAAASGTLVGMCVLELRADGAWLEHVWIAPEAQRRGIGRALVEEALRAAAALGISRVTLASDPFAEQFYMKLGAKPYGFEPAPMPGDATRALSLFEFKVEARFEDSESPGDDPQTN